MKYLEKKLDQIKENHLYRFLKNYEGEIDAVQIFENREYINFSSNNYLGLANHPFLKKTSVEAIEKFGTSSGASRLITGSHLLYEELENKIAKFKGTESALTFNSGYHANIGVINTLMNEGDSIFSDSLNHASLIDGCRLSKAKTHIYDHQNLEQLEKLLKSSSGNKMIITDGIFSMDGDLAKLDKLNDLAKKYETWLYIDDAHATGVIGDHGRGSLNHFNLDAKQDHLILMGTFGKALGSFGAYICGSQNLIDFLINKSRSFIYTTALPPSIIAANIASIDFISKNDSLLKKLWENISYFKNKMKDNVRLLKSDSAIFPFIIGDAEKTMRLSQKLFDNGLIVQGIRPPTVPENSSRLRITLTASHLKTHIDDLVKNLKEIE